MTKTSLISLVSLAVLAGCAVSPKYDAPHVAPLALAAPEQHLFAPAEVQQDWWRQLEDPQLDVLVERSLANNHDIRVAQARLLEARASQTEAELDRLPSVSPGAGHSRSTAQGNGVPADARTTVRSSRIGFDASWEIDLFGRLARVEEAARVRTQAQAADPEQVRIVVVAELARSYYEMRGAEHRIAVTGRMLASLRESQRITEALVRHGRGLSQDLASARSNLASTESQLPLLETERRQAMNRVAVLSGLRPIELEPMLKPQQLAPIAKRLPLGDLSDLLRRRPDVLRAERALAASTADVGAATADLYPRLNIGAFLGFVALRGADLGSMASRASSFAVDAAWPALTSGSPRARLRAADARAQGARAVHEQTVLRAVEEAENALAAYGQNQRRLQSLLEASAQSRRAADLAAARYREGAGPYLEVLDTQRVLLTAQDALAEAETTSYTSLVAVYKAVGGGWRGPAEPEAQAAR